MVKHMDGILAVVTGDCHQLVPNLCFSLRLAWRWRGRIDAAGSSLLV